MSDCDYCYDEPCTCTAEEFLERYREDEAEQAAKRGTSEAVLSDVRSEHPRIAERLGLLADGWGGR